MSFALLCSFLFTFNVSVVQWLYMQWLFKVGAKSLQCSIKNRYIQRTMFIWLFFERSILAHLKNSLNDTDSNTQKVWWIIWETSGLPTRDTIYMFNMMIENKIYSITLTCTRWFLVTSANSKCKYFHNQMRYEHDCFSIINTIIWSCFYWIFWTREIIFWQ